jgi:TonB family protein
VATAALGCRVEQRSTDTLNQALRNDPASHQVVPIGVTFLDFLPINSTDRTESEVNSVQSEAGERLLIQAAQSDEARRIRYQGVVVLSVVVDPSGHPRNIHILRALGLGLDEKAIQAVQKWKFEPGMKDGRPVAVAVNVEVNFRLY